MQSTTLARMGIRNGWVQDGFLMLVLLVFGFCIMPLMIYWAGSVILGRYDTASIAHLFDSLYRGLQSGSLASWTVVLGPCALYLIFGLLRSWWRASAWLAKSPAA